MSTWLPFLGDLRADGTREKRLGGNGSDLLPVS